MTDNEIAEIHRRTTAAVTAAIQAAGQLAQVAIRARVAQLQRAAQASDEQARRIRAQVRAAQQADAAVWRPATRASWWQRASADDMARAWRASAGWAAVDPRAQAAQRVMKERLAERGVQVDPPADDRPGDSAWLSDQLDRAAADAAGGRLSDEGLGEKTGPDGRAAEAGGERVGQPRRADRQREVGRRREQMAGHVRAAWPADRAERVIGSQAWPVLAFKLDQLDQAGHDVEAMLRAVPGFVDQARTPAAYAYRVMDDAEAEMRAQRAAADEQRASERDARTVEAEWRESATDPQTVAETHADDAHAAAGQHADLAAHHEYQAAAAAAQRAAQGYPQRTDTAIAEAKTSAPAAASKAAARQAKPRVTARPSRGPATR